jgi:hypothetical protein
MCTILSIITVIGREGITNIIIITDTTGADTADGTEEDITGGRIFNNK